MDNFFLADPFLEAHYDALNQYLIEHHASLRRSISPEQAANVADLADQYQFMNRDVIVGAGLMGLTSGSPEMQDLAWRQAKADAEDEAESRNWFERNILDPAMGIFKGTARVAFTVFDFLWEEGMSRPFKTVVAALGMSDQHGFMNPINAWKEAGTSIGGKVLGEILRGNWNINLGEGFIPRSTQRPEDTSEYRERVAAGENPSAVIADIRAGLGRPITQEARAEQEQLTMHGLPISPGRFAALAAHNMSGGTMLEPGTTGFNIMSGALDAAIIMGTMRVGRLPTKIPEAFGKLAPKPLRGKPIPLPQAWKGQEIPVLGGMRYPIPGDPAATVLKHIGQARQLSRKLSDLDPQAFYQAARAQGASPLYAGLITGIRKTVHPPSVESWLSSRFGRSLTQLIDHHITEDNWGILVDWFSAKNRSLPQEFFRELGRAGPAGRGGETAADVLRRWARPGGLEVAPTVVGSMSPFRGVISRELGGAMARMGKTGAERQIAAALGELGGFRAGRRMGFDSYGWGRQFKDMVKRTIDVESPRESFFVFNDWLISAGFDLAKRTHHLNRYADLAQGELSAMGIHRSVEDAFEDFAKQLQQDGVPDPLAEYLVRGFRHDKRTRIYASDNACDPLYGPTVELKLMSSDPDVAIIQPSAVLEPEFRQRAIPLPDAREVRHALSRIRRHVYYGPDPTSGKPVSRIGSGHYVYEMTDPQGLTHKISQAQVDEYTQKGYKLLNKDPEWVQGTYGKGARMWLRDPKKGAQQAYELNDIAVQRWLDNYTQRFWKPMTLLRVAWPVRVIGEEQLRMAAAGYVSLFNHPIQWLTYIIGGGNDMNRVGKALDWLGIAPRGRTLTGLDFGDIDPRRIDDFVKASHHGKNADEAITYMNKKGFKLDPNDPADVARVQRIRDEGLLPNEILLSLSDENKLAMSRAHGNLGGYEQYPVAAEVWSPIGRGKPLFDASWADELLQLRGSRIARLVAADDVPAAVAWLKTPDGRNWMRQYAQNLDVSTAAGRARAATLQDERSWPMFVEMIKARLWIKTGGRAQLFIDDIPVLGGTMTRAQYDITQDITQWHKMRVEYARDPNPVLRKFVADGVWPELGPIGLGKMSPAQKAKWVDDLGSHYRDFAPDFVKGAVDGAAKRAIPRAYDEAVEKLFNLLMSRPTNFLSRSPAFRQSIWRFLNDAVPYASPAVHEDIRRAARNANLSRKEMAQLETNILRAQHQANYTTLDPSVAARGQRVEAMSALPDEELLRRMIGSRLMDDLRDAKKANPNLDVSDWWASRVRVMGADDLDDADIAMQVLWERHADELGRISGQAMSDLNDHAARVLGVDPSAAAVQQRRVLLAHTQGVSVADLARQEQVSQTTIRRWINQAQAQPHARMQQAALLHGQVNPATGRNYTWTEVGATLGVSPRTARRWGAQAPRADQILEDELDRLWELWGGERAHGMLGDHFDHYTNRVGGQRRVISPHTFDDLIDPATGEVVARGFQDLEDLAKAHALEDVKNLLYDTTRRHGVMDILRNVFPFGEAWVEVLSTWARLMVQNPQILRRGQIMIEGARDAGFLYTDPQSGEEMFNYPGSGMIFNAATKQPANVGITATAGAMAGGIGGLAGMGPFGAFLGAAAGAAAGAIAPGMGMMPAGNLFTGPLGIPSEGNEVAQPGAGAVGMTAGAPLKSLNLMTGSVLPGFGPVVQVLASELLRDNPGFDAVREIITPFGDQRIRGIEDIADLTMPRWATRFMAAVGMGTPDTERVFMNSVIDVYKVLVLTQGEPENAEESNRYLEQAKKLARKLSLYRSFAYMFAPAVPQMEFHVEDKEGKLWLFQSLATEYSKILSETGSEAEAFDRFWRLYGLDPTVFATSKSVTIAPRNMTSQGDRWARANSDLFDQAPATAYYAHPDLAFDESFVYDAYVRQLNEGARQSLSPEQWVSRRNDTLGRILFEKARREADERLGPRSSAQKTYVLRYVRQWLIDKYPGYKMPNPGVAEPYSYDQKIREIREQWFGQRVTGHWPDGSNRWTGDGTGGDPRLRDSEAGRAMWLWLQAVDRMTAEVTAQGLTADSGLWQSKAGWPYRETLRQYAAILMRQYDDFQYVYRLMLERRFPDDDVLLPSQRSA